MSCLSTLLICLLFIEPFSVLSVWRVNDRRPLSVVRLLHTRNGEGDWLTHNNSLCGCDIVSAPD